MLLALLLPTALAYEVDPWTAHLAPPADAIAAANLAMDRRLDEALAGLARCNPARPERLRRQVGRAIARTTARRVTVDRPGLARLGHGAYSAWLETSPEVDRVVTGTDGIYAEVGLFDSPILHLAGTAATVRLGDTLVGTDKVDHFLATGFDYWRWSRWSRRPTRAVRRGVRSEQRFLGRLTSKAFSYGDLSANWDGYRFYEGLLGPDSLLQPVEGDDTGCVARTGSWDWSAWVSWEWDELQNPSVYGPRVRRALEDRLAPERDAVCASWEPRTPSAPLVGRPPPQPGPFGLEGFCP